MKYCKPGQRATASMCDGVDTELNYFVTCFKYNFLRSAVMIFVD